MFQTLYTQVPLNDAHLYLSGIVPDRSFELLNTNNGEPFYPSMPHLCLAILVHIPARECHLALSTAPAYWFDCPIVLI